MNLGLLLVLVHVNSVLGVSRYGCVKPDKFENANKGFFPPNIKEGHNNLSLLQVLIRKGKEIARGIFGVVISIIGGIEALIIKIQKPKIRSIEYDVGKEVTLSKYFCDVDVDEDFSEFIPCEGKPIMPFKGCVEAEDGDEVYIFQKKAYYSLENKNAIKIYRSFSPMYRLAVILRIIDKVIEIHDKGIIHSDIKLANIVSRDPFLEQIQLIDLGFAGIDQFEFIGGSYGYLPPEYLPNDLSNKLSPQLDIYSLAITMMYLEKGFNTAYDTADSSCFLKKFTEDCHKKLITAVKTILNVDHPFYHLQEIIIRALSYKKEDRQRSVIQLKIEIVKVIPTIFGFKKFFNFLVLEEKVKALLNLSQVNLDPLPTKIHTWIEDARAIDLMVERPLDPEPRSCCRLFCFRSNIINTDPPKHILEKQQHYQKQLELMQPQQALHQLLQEQKQQQQQQLQQQQLEQQQQKSEEQLKQEQEDEQIQQSKQKIEFLQQLKKILDHLHRVKRNNLQLKIDREKKQEEQDKNQKTNLQLNQIKMKVQPPEREKQNFQLQQQQNKKKKELPKLQYTRLSGLDLKHQRLRKELDDELQLEQEQMEQMIKKEQSKINDIEFNRYLEQIDKEVKKIKSNSDNKSNQVYIFDLSQKTKDQHLKNQNLENHNNVKNKANQDVKKDVQEEDSALISEYGNIPKHQDLGNYNSHSFWGGYSQHVKQQQQSQKLNFLI